MRPLFPRSRKISGNYSELESADPSQVREVHGIELEINRMRVEWAAPLLSRMKSGEWFDASAALQEGEARLGFSS